MNAWGVSWGGAWADSWGSVAQSNTLGGGYSERHKGWQPEREKVHVIKEQPVYEEIADELQDAAIGKLRDKLILLRALQAQIAEEDDFLIALNEYRRRQAVMVYLTLTIN